MNYNRYQLGIMAAIISFLGFVVENIWLLITKGYINNRNMSAPFLVGYGMLMLFMYAVFGVPQKQRLFRKVHSKRLGYILYFISAFMIVCVGEVALGTIVEELCSIEYWNYANLPLHVTKYTSVPTSVAFAFMITFFMGKVFPVLMGWISHIDDRWTRIISIVLWIIMLSDLFSSFCHMIKSKGFNLKWQINFGKPRLK